MEKQERKKIVKHKFLFFLDLFLILLLIFIYKSIDLSLEDKSKIIKDTNTVIINKVLDFNISQRGYITKYGISIHGNKTTFTGAFDKDARDVNSTKFPKQVIENVFQHYINIFKQFNSSIKYININTYASNEFIENNQSKYPTNIEIAQNRVKNIFNIVEKNITNDTNSSKLMKAVRLNGAIAHNGNNTKQRNIIFSYSYYDITSEKELRTISKQMCMFLRDNKNIILEKENMQSFLNLINSNQISTECKALVDKYNNEY